jgi:hypothetical protein
MAKKNSSVLWTVQQSLEKTDKELARKNIGFDTFQTPKSDSGNALKFVTDIVEESNGDLKYNTKSVEVLETYDSTSGKPASGKSIKAAIDTLTSSSTLTGGNYYTGMTETAGIVTLTQAAMDTSPTQNSTKPVTSGGVFTVTNSLSNSIDTINQTISNMDYTDSAVANQFVTSVSETDGVISVSRAQPTAAGISGLKAFSTVSDGTYSFEAAAYNSTLTFAAGMAIDPVVDATNKVVKFNHKDYRSAEGTILPSNVSLTGYDIKLPWAVYNRQGHITDSGQYIFNVTHPGAGELQFKFGSASAVSTGFNANSGSNVTYTFPNADKSAYGVTKLYKYGSTDPTDWSSFSTLDDTAATPKSVAQYFSDNDDKQMVGTGSHAPTTGYPESLYVPFTVSSVGNYQHSYVSVSNTPLFVIDKDTSDYYSAKLNGNTLAQYQPVTGTPGQLANQVIVANDNDHEMVTPLTDTIGDSCDTDVGNGNYMPVFIKQGKITALPRLEPDYQTTPTNLQGITMRLDSQGWYCIGTLSLQSVYKYVAGTPASGADPAVAARFNLTSSRGVLYGDGFGYSTDLGSYWDVSDLNKDNRTPVVVEAPSVTYAVTVLASSWNSGFEYEVWNKHRWTDYTDCVRCRLGTDNPASTSKYVATKAIVGSGDICILPPHHWGLFYVTVDGHGSLRLASDVSMLAESGSQNLYCVSPDLCSRCRVGDNVEIKYNNISQMVTIASFGSGNEVHFDRSDSRFVNHSCSITYRESYGKGSATTLSFGIHDTAGVGGIDSEGDPDCLYHQNGIVWTESDPPYGGENSVNKMPLHHASFMCYNPSNSEKYVTFATAGPSDAEYTIYKQMLIFKTPEHGGFNMPTVSS